LVILAFLIGFLRKKTKLEQKQVLSASKWKKKEAKTIVSL